MRPDHEEVGRDYVPSLLALPEGWPPPNKAAAH